MSSDGGGQNAFSFMNVEPKSTRNTSASDDTVARERIRSELHVNLVVEAAAGTGKTTNLVDRLVALIATGVAEPRQIAAITFTKKAAGELRERFQNVLEREATKAEPDSPRLANIRRGLEQIDQSYLGTIHSFCGRMLRERPVEAGVAPDFRELEEIEATALNEEVWSSYVQELYLERSDLLLALDQTDLTIVELRTLMLSLCDETDVELVTEKSSRPDVRPAWRELIRIAEELERQMPSAAPEKGWDELQKLIRSTAALRRARDPDDLDVVRLLKFFESSNPAGKVKNNRWPDSDPDEIKETIRSLCEEIVAPTLRAWREYCHPIAIEVVVPAIERARETRIDLGRLSFQDLLTIARDLLRDHLDVRRWFQNRYRFVLVDEFQDTDPIQAEILFYLTGEGDATSWRNLRPRPGSLFIVGDPKQSIYRFRRADIALYKEVKDLIVGSGGEVLQLAKNFRSTGRLCGWVNDRFSAILPEEESPEQAGMVRVEAHRPDEGGFGGIYVQRFTGKGIGQVVQQEAGRIAEWIRDAVHEKRTIVDQGIERPMRWGDFMILARERPRLKMYAEALERQMIPYEITGGRGFSSSRELRALAAFLRAVIDPDDQVSLVAFLRGPLAGVSDDELWRFREAEGRWSYLGSTPDDAPEAVLVAYEHLRRSRSEALELSPAAVIGRAVDRLGIAAWSLAMEGGQTRSGNLYKAMTIARRMSSNGESLTAIVEELTRLSDEQNDLEELSLRASSENVVRIMNLHQAKGLESHVVFLVDPRDKGPRSPLSHVDRTTEPALAHVTVTKPRKFGGAEILAQPRNWDEHAERECQFIQAEEARLLYVAATRAREALVVSNWSRGTGERGPWVDLVTDDLPDLPECLSERSEIEERPLDLEVGDEAASINEALELVRKPSWEVRSASAEGHALPGAAAGAAGRGASWGRVLHRALEVMINDEELDLRALAGNLLRDEGRSENEAEDAVQWLLRVKETSLWKRAKESERALVEVPFATLREEQDKEVVLRGVADMVFRENDRWVIVDYKSDATSGRLDQLVESYRSQIEAYARVWHEQTGEATRGYLLFLDGSHEVEVARF